MVILLGMLMGFMGFQGNLINHSEALGELMTNHNKELMPISLMP